MSETKNKYEGDLENLVKKKKKYERTCIKIH